MGCWNETCGFSQQSIQHGEVLGGVSIFEEGRIISCNNS